MLVGIGCLVWICSTSLPVLRFARLSMALSVCVCYNCRRRQLAQEQQKRQQRQNQHSQQQEQQPPQQQHSQQLAAAASSAESSHQQRAACAQQQAQAQRVAARSKQLEALALLQQQDPSGVTPAQAKYHKEFRDASVVCLSTEIEQGNVEYKYRLTGCATNENRRHQLVRYCGVVAGMWLVHMGGVGGGRRQWAWAGSEQGSGSVRPGNLQEEGAEALLCGQRFTKCTAVMRAVLSLPWHVVPSRAVLCCAVSLLLLPQQQTTQMKFRLSEGSGECFYYLGVEDDGYPRGLEPQELQDSIAVIHRMAKSLQVSTWVVGVTAWVQVLCACASPVARVVG